MARPSLEDVMEAVQEDDNSGFCGECGEQAWGVEPDARGYECENCGAEAVNGAEEWLLMLA